MGLAWGAKETKRRKDNLTLVDDSVGSVKGSSAFSYTCSSKSGANQASLLVMHCTPICCLGRCEHRTKGFKQHIRALRSLQISFKDTI